MCSILVFGWLIDYNCLITYLEKNKASSCKKVQCICGPDCWNNDVYNFPENIYYIWANYYDTNDFDYTYAISLIHQDFIKVEDINKIMLDKELLYNGAILSEKLGGDKEPEIFSLINIS